jgi:hypothetical protein
MNEYQGTWWSDEVQTAYVITADGEQLVASHPLNGTTTLRSTGDDRFSTTQWYMPEIRFVRDATSRIEALEVRSEDAGALRFRKL